jgi:hypothetical protein
LIPDSSGIFLNRGACHFIAKNWTFSMIFRQKLEESCKLQNVCNGERPLQYIDHTIVTTGATCGGGTTYLPTYPKYPCPPIVLVEFVFLYLCFRKAVSFKSFPLNYSDVVQRDKVEKYKYIWCLGKSCQFLLCTIKQTNCVYFHTGLYVCMWSWLKIKV